MLGTMSPILDTNMVKKVVIIGSKVTKTRKNQKAKCIKTQAVLRSQSTYSRRKLVERASRPHLRSHSCLNESEPYQLHDCVPYRSIVSSNIILICLSISDGLRYYVELDPPAVGMLMIEVEHTQGFWLSEFLLPKSVDR